MNNMNFKRKLPIPKDIKEQYPDTLLFYRLGDFYEMFFDGGIKLVEHYIVSSNECRAMQVSKLLGYDQNTV